MVCLGEVERDDQQLVCAGMMWTSSLRRPVWNIHVRFEMNMMNECEKCMHCVITFEIKQCMQCIQGRAVILRTACEGRAQPWHWVEGAAVIHCVEGAV